MATPIPPAVPHPTGPSPSRRRGGVAHRVGWWRHAVALLCAVFALIPIVFVVSAAFNPRGTLGSTTLWPSGAGLENFRKLFTSTDYGRWFGNSLLISAAAGALSMFASACGAYAFSRFRFRGRRAGMTGLLLVQMFPQFLAVVAIYLMFTWITARYPGIGFNTSWALILLYMGGALGANTWLMKGFFDTVPKSLDESAKVDGASHAQVFFTIMLPLVSPVLAVTGLLSFIGTMNEFLLANIFLTDPEAKTLAVGLYGMIQEGNRDANFGLFCAGSLLMAIPIVALFLYLQRFIVSGLTSGAVKG
ncbi:sugar ABC transporter permease [Streptomyces spiroverticillatus]|uniref:Sugar ABC transporter permease n=1 Tax=Streptomyces finlayi TaxID=67296 RepID=A0A918WZQ4_9ACTN|nr:sugar ABC transporter permease [Streptomyces finlayi]GHA17046.1 sugar ABC transporter permease [Streptomyces spiroverticillatus]GHC99095.1 sugar ABC transporter permease [Streptomyces finlayi]